MGNAYSPEINWQAPNSDFSKQIKWKTNIGMWHSAVAVEGDKLHSIGNYEVAENEFENKVVCLNANTGVEIWEYSYSCHEQEDSGPFSTPVLDKGQLFTQSREGYLHCLNALNGKLIWKHHLINRQLVYSNSNFACSPLIVGSKLVLNLNKTGIAFNKNTGEFLWNSDKYINGYSSAFRFDYKLKIYTSIQTTV